jgi:diadenosine tetraphosphatase ApaH/serine/threonine PP2A family protein phosphatase
VCGGDVAAGPFPAECVALLRGRGAVFVRGNADRDLHSWAAGRLSAEERDALAALPTTEMLAVDGIGPVRFCHATPRSDDEIVTRLTPDSRLAEILAGVTEPVVVAGHTHVQFDRRIGSHRFVNAGSVGMPYEGRRGAFWALLGPDVDLRRTEYDVEDAVERIRATGHPDADQLAQWLREPVDPEEASSYFERGARVS